MSEPNQIIGHRYWNCNGYATAIVAAATPGVDWAAYIGGAPEEMREKDAVVFVSRYGCKLSEKDARHFFLCPLPYRD